jgi:histone deacetylase 6
MMATEVMYQVAKVQSRYWKCIDVKACEPLDGESERVVYWDSLH